MQQTLKPTKHNLTQPNFTTTTLPDIHYPLETLDESI